MSMFSFTCLDLFLGREFADGSIIFTRVPAQSQALTVFHASFRGFKHGGR